MLVYHISLASHRESISNTGIRRTRSGIDGPGIYVWTGSKEEALNHAYDDLYDNNEDVDDLDLDVWQLDIPDCPRTLMEWEDYIVLDYDVVQSSDIKLLGNLQEILKRIRYPIENRLCPHCYKPVIRSEITRYVWQCLSCEEDFFDIECPESEDEDDG